MEKTTTEHTEGETTMNDSEFIAESFAKTTVCENDNLEMIGLCHVGMYAKNPASLAEFYRDVMGMQIVDRSDASHPAGASAFLSDSASQLLLRYFQDALAIPLRIRSGLSVR